MASENGTMNLAQLLQIVSMLKVITDNEDVLREILLKLPVKFLLRAKSVSKQFCRMISDPLFGYLYHRTNPETSCVVSLLLYKLDSPLVHFCNFIYLMPEALGNPFWLLPFININSDIHSISSCSGLLCLCIVRYEGFQVLDAYNYYICNPTTSKSIKLPELNRHLPSRIESMSIVFEPQKSPFYKVVCVWTWGMRYRFSVYSSETKMWRNTGASLEVRPDDNYMFTNGVFWNGSLHWIGETGPFVRFDVNEECLGRMPMTQVSNNDARRIQYFGESFGFLYLIELRGYCSPCFVIYEMKRDYSDWSQLIRLDLSWLFPVQSQDRILGNYSIQFFVPPVRMNGLWGTVVSTPESTYFCSFRGGLCIFRWPSRLYHDAGFMHEYKWYHTHQFITTLAAV